MNITVISVSTEAIRSMAACVRRLESEHPGFGIRPALYAAARSDCLDRRDALCADVRGADIAVIDLMGCGPRLIEAVSDALEGCKGQRIVIGTGCMDKLRLGTLTRERMTAMGKRSGGAKQPPRMMTVLMKHMGGAGGDRGLMAKLGDHMMKKRTGLDAPGLRDLKNFGRIADYWQSGTESDMRSILLLLLREYFGFDGLDAPDPIAGMRGVSIANLAGGFERYESGRTFRKANPPRAGLPWVALLYHGHNYPNRTEDCVAGIARRLSAFCNVLPVAFAQSTHKDMDALERLVRGACGRPSLVLNFMPFRLGAGPMGGDAQKAVDLLKSWNAPCLHPYFITKYTMDDWRARTKGATPGEFLISIMLPELDGFIETLPIGALVEVEETGTTYGAELARLGLIEERADALCARVKGWLDLKGKPAEDKRVALICYNYPPGEGNLFGGAFLDTFRSVSGLLRAFKDAGYQVETPSAEELKALFEERRICNLPRWNDGARMDAPRMDGDAYAARMAGSSLYFAIFRQWGTAPGDVMTDGNRLLVPGLRLGNVFIGLQPARGGGESYHDQSIMPHHQYAAFYRYLHDDFRADAVVHVGTHGTLEFLPGKEAGMSGDCAPDALIGDAPHIYLYYCGNPSEAMIAKRRTRALCIGYRPPEFVKSGLYGEYARLEAALHECREAEKIAPERVEHLKGNLAEQSRSLGLPEETDALEQELYRMKTSMMPSGLHVFGEEPDGKRNGEIPALLRALRGEYIEMGLAGDVLRSPEVLPSGRNLYQFDARYIPSPAAMERGRAIADATIAKYFGEHGEYPRSTAVILWGLETSRTQGETVGQILAYLGARTAPRKDSFDTRFELIPLEKLGRPRIDVTIHICGFFRDMFPNLLQGFYELYRLLMACGEREEDNAFLANAGRIYEKLILDGCPSTRARELSMSRIFGPREGEYGTELTGIVERGAWKTEAELAASFTGSLSHVYNENSYGRRTEGLLELSYSAVELVSQIRSDAEYELTDLDHYYEFFGGLAKSVELARGKSAALYVADTTMETPVADAAAASIARGARTRLLNPKWIGAMLAHGYHGVQKINERFSNMLGLAATTNSVDSSIFARMYDTYVADAQIRQRMAQSNPAAYMRLLERMLESSARGYWQSGEDELAALKDAILRMESDLEDGG